MPAASEVHLVRPEEVPVATASLVRAFWDDPMLTYMFPDSRNRARAMSRFFTIQLRQSPKRHGLAYTTEGCRSTALWIPPRTGPPTVRDALAQIPTLLSLGRRAGATLRLAQLVETRHPKLAHYYLGGLGTDPQWQGRGLGSAVIGPVLEICDRDGLPAYLESSKEANLNFYRRQGFEVTDEVSVPDGSVRLWLMWREPLGSS
jgi:ribosomal protein S18 acetylase RimI-like enzyme